MKPLARHRADAREDSSRVSRRLSLDTLCSPCATAITSFLSFVCLADRAYQTRIILPALRKNLFSSAESVHGWIRVEGTVHPGSK